MHSVANMFGTDGIRGQMGDYPLSLEYLPLIGKAIACWAQEKYGTAPHILMGHDTRASCTFVKAALKSGLFMYPTHVYDTHVLPTPALFKVMQHHTQFQCGIIISASHNPHQDNGIKLIDATSGKITHKDELTISAMVHASGIKTHSYNSYGTEVAWPHAAQQYQELVCQLFQPLFLRGKKIVIDCANGATAYCAPLIFQALGADTVVLNAEPNGTNINHECGSLHPHKTARAVLEHNADIGFAFDGDGDRVMVITKHGEIKNGDDILALLLDHPHYANTASIVGTVLTNQGLEAFLHTKQKKLIRVPVGDKYIAERLDAEHLVLGGEQSGHIIMHDYLPTGDGIYVALRVLETLLLTNNWELQTFTKYPQVSVNVPVTEKKDLTLPPFCQIIAEGQTQLPAGRLIVRYSGTESLLRITAEDASLFAAQRVVEILSQKLQKELV